MTIVMFLLGVLPLTVCILLGRKATNADPQSFRIKAFVGVICFVLALLAAVNGMQWLPDAVKNFLLRYSMQTVLAYRILFTLGVSAIGWFVMTFFDDYSERLKLYRMEAPEPVGQIVPIEYCKEGTARYQEANPGAIYGFTFDMACIRELQKPVGARQVHMFLMYDEQGRLDTWLAPGDGLGNLIELPLPNIAARSGDGDTGSTGGGALNHAGTTPPKGDGKG